MDDFKIFEESLVHLSRLALTGSRNDVELYLRRLLRKLGPISPKVKEQLLRILEESPTRNSPLRNKNFESIPIDKDSRLNLLKFEASPLLDHDPILSEHNFFQIEAIVEERKQAKGLLENDLDPAKAVLFSGPPGVGKTLTAKWIAKRLGLPIFTLDLSAVMSSFLGRTGNNVKNVFEYAKGGECVLFLDELDAIAKKRDDTGEVGELKRLVNVLLQEIDSWPSTNLLIAATNHPNLLDPAIWRRFDYLINFENPSENKILELLGEKLSQGTKNKKLLIALSKILQGESFSEVTRICSSIRKESYLYQIDLDELIKNYIKRMNSLEGLSKEEQINASVVLKQAGLPERTIREITGCSRDTIRKYSKQF